MSPCVYEDWPVPPLSACKVPANVILPLVVIGPPEVVKPVVPPLTSIEVTVPPPIAVCNWETSMYFTDPPAPSDVSESINLSSLATVIPVPSSWAFTKLFTPEVWIPIDKVPAPEVFVIALPTPNVATTGSAPVEPTINWPLVAWPNAVIAPVPLPTNTPPSVNG